MQELEFRSHFAQSAEGREALAKLIEDIFGLDVSPLDRLGHDPSVIPFGYWHGSELVANVSLYERHLWLAGRETKAFGVQSVAVRPEWRGKGLFRDLMERALAHADQRAELVILSTGTPDLYAPFGFRRIIEAAFTGHFAATASDEAPRRLSMANDADVVLLRELFARRAPVSLLASACDHPALFMLKAATEPEIELFHLPGLDAIVAIRKEEGAPPELLDVVAPVIPPLQAICNALGHEGGEISVMLTPDRLSWVPESRKPVDNRQMVRGPFAPENEAFMLTDMTV